MSILNSAYLTAPQILQARQIVRGVVDVNNGLSYAEFLQMIGDYEKATSTKFWHLQNSSSVGVGDSTGATITGSGTATVTVTTTAQTQGYFRKDDVVKLKNNKNALVYSVTTAGGQDTHTLHSIDGSNLTFTAGDPLVLSGVAIPEGGLPRTPINYPVTAIYNLIQSFGDSTGVTDIASFQEVEIVVDGKKHYYYENNIKTVERVTRILAATMIGGQISTAVFQDGANSTLLNQDGKPTQTMMGLDQAATTYGAVTNVASAGSFGLADMQSLTSLQLAQKVTDNEIWAIGGTMPRTELDIYLKGLNSSSVTSARLNVDGREVDFMVDKFTFGGFTYYFRTIKTFDDQEMFPLNGSNIAKSMYFMPKGKISTTDGPKSYFHGMYFDPRDIKYPVTGDITLDHMIYEAPVAYTGERANKWEISSYQSVDWLGAKFFTKFTM